MKLMISSQATRRVCFFFFVLSRKSLIKGASQIQNHLSARKSRPSRRPVPSFRPQNPPHADFSFRPTDFPVSSYRLFRRPYRLVFVSLRGHSDESYGPQTVSILLTPGIDKRAKLNSRRENVEGCPDGEASRAHQRVRTWSSAHAMVSTGRGSSAHCSVRQCPLQRPPVPTGESAGGHWRIGWCPLESERSGVSSIVSWRVIELP